MTTFSEVWSSLQQPGKPLPFVLIDCAGIEGGAAQLPRYIFSEVQCLFVGNLATELADVGPYLGQLRSLDADVARTVQNLLAKHAGMLVLIGDKPKDGVYPSFSHVYRHFRKCNLVTGPDGEQLFFRYYDPRVLMQAMQAFDAEQLKELFGPVGSFIIFDLNKNIVEFRN